MNMNYTSNRTYFKPKKLLRYVGGTFCLLAVPCLFFIRVMAIVPFIIGLLCLLVSRELNVRGTDVEEQIKAETDRMENALEDKYYDVKHPFPKMQVTVIGDYVTEGEGLLMRRSSLGKNITSRYHAVAIGIKNGNLYFTEEYFSTIDDSDYRENAGEFTFSDLDKVVYGPAEGAKIEHSELALIDVKGNEVFRVPAPTDYTTEKFAEDMNIIFARHREENSQNSIMSNGEKTEEENGLT